MKVYLVQEIIEVDMGDYILTTKCVFSTLPLAESYVSKHKSRWDRYSIEGVDVLTEEVLSD